MKPEDAQTQGNARRRKRGSPIITLLGILVMLFSCVLIYTIFYHDGPPVPVIEDFFNNVTYELSDAQSLALAGEGIYTWSITNRNDFSWPDAAIEYGDHHIFPLGKVEPGQEVAFGNLILFNLETQEVESVPLEKGESVMLKLYINFADEDSFPSRFWKVFNLEKQEHYRIGNVNR